MLSAQAALIVGSLVTTIPLIQYNTNPMMYPLSLDSQSPTEEIKIFRHIRIELQSLKVKSCILYSIMHRGSMKVGLRLHKQISIMLQKKT
jgi:hypothetical protein